MQNIPLIALCGRTMPPKEVRFHIGSSFLDKESTQLWNLGFQRALCSTCWYSTNIPNKPYLCQMNVELQRFKVWGVDLPFSFSYADHLYSSERCHLCFFSFVSLKLEVQDGWDAEVCNHSAPHPENGCPSWLWV